MRVHNRRHLRWSIVLLGMTVLSQVFVSAAVAFVPGGFWRWNGIGFGPGYHAYHRCDACGRASPGRLVPQEGMPAVGPIRSTPVWNW